MTQEKQLLLKVFCAGLPYGLKYNFGGNDGCDYTMDRVSLIAVDDAFPIEEVKPYLRPMSSMTKEEKHKLLKFGAITCLENGEVIDVSCVGFERHADIQDYLNSRHFDYRGLIPMGLALEAPKDMYKEN